MEEQDSISISIDSEIKTIAEQIFKQFGITKSQAIELFYRQVAMTKDISFIHRNLNRETIQAIEELREKATLTTYTNFTELRQDLEV